MNLVNGLSWHNDVYLNLCLKSSEGVWKCFPDKNQKCFLIIENKNLEYMETGDK